MSREGRARLADGFLDGRSGDVDAAIDEFGADDLAVASAARRKSRQGHQAGPATRVVWGRTIFQRRWTWWRCGGGRGGSTNSPRFAGREATTVSLGTGNTRG